MYNLKNFHNLEYKLNACSFYQIFLFSFLSLTIVNVRIFVYREYKLALEQGFCLRWSKESHEFDVLDILYNNFAFNMQIPSLILAYAVINYKNTFDVLQGISKLDSLVRVSMFQRDKITPPRIDSQTTDGDPNHRNSSRSERNSRYY